MKTITTTITTMAQSELIRHDRLRHVLAVCGVNNTGPTAGRQTTEFINSQGFHSILDFNGLSQSDIGRLVKAFSYANPVTGNLGFMVQKKLEALAFWITDRTTRQVTVNHLEWDDDACLEARSLADISEQRKANPQTVKRVDKISTGLKWYTWQNKFSNYLSTIRGVGDTPLSYIIRPDKPQGWNPMTDAANDEEKLIYQVSLTGPVFNVDNKTVHAKLLEVTMGEPAYEWIKSFEKTQDGRGAYSVLRTHCEGTDFTELRVNEADRIMKTITYTNERHFSFDAYTTKLQEAFTTYEAVGQPYPDRQKVRHMIDRMNVYNNTKIAIAKEHVIDNFGTDWINAVNFMKTKVVQAFPNANSDDKRRSSRYINETNAGGRGRGRGSRGGRFTRGGGRGRGRGGRGDFGRGGRGLSDDAAIPKTCNGVDTANIFRAFRDDEWAALGRDWQRLIRERREAAKARDGDTHGNRNRSAYQQNSYYRDRNNYYRNPDPKSAETPDDTTSQEDAKSEKGGKAGLGFGSNKYYEDRKGTK